jgi:CheY-like chemotaxis protein
MESKLDRCAILIADDDADDRFLIRKALEENGVKNQIQFLADGQELVDHLNEHLKSTPSGKSRDLPCLILLDLNMPRMDGHTALKIVKGHDQLKEIPIVILSNSKNPRDVSTSYQEGANSFFTKPLDYKDLVGLMDLLKTYWFQNAQLPYEES